MSNLQIRVSRWSPDDNEPVVSTYEQTNDCTWIQTGSEPGALACSLEEIMFVAPNGALSVETSGTMSADALAAALPRSSEYLEYFEEIETGDEVLDHFLGSENRQVAINGRHYASFPVESDQFGAMTWLECDPEYLERDCAVPRGRQIAWASGIENESRLAGTFSWSLIDVGNYVCFIVDPADDEASFKIEERQSRTNRELADDFWKWVDWGPVANAVARAIELGGVFVGLASELDEDGSDSCEVNAYIDLDEAV